MLAKHLVVWVTTSAFLISASAATDRPQRQDGSCVHVGRPAQPGEFPFLALLEITSGDSTWLCSGSIPSPTTVLTCARCDNDNVTAYAGIVSNEEKELRNGQVQVRSVESKVKYNNKYFFDYDIMVFYVNQSWEWTEIVAPVALQLSEGSLQPSFVTSCQVMSFVVTEPYSDTGTGMAHVMDQLVGSGSQCMEKFSLYFFSSYYMCTVNVENKPLCGEVKGGPVVCGGQQWAISRGVYSWGGVPLDPPTAVSRYLYVAMFRDWILNNIKDLPSSADSIQRFSAKISMDEAVLYQPLWLVLLMTVQLLYLH